MDLTFQIQLNALQQLWINLGMLSIGRMMKIFDENCVEIDPALVSSIYL